MTGLEIRPLRPGAETERADRALPLHRLEQPRSEYLVAWEGEAPLGHVCLEWRDPPELQDLWVLPGRRSEGIGSALVAAVEERAGTRGHARVALTVGIGNRGAIRLYERLGYARTAAPPRRITGTVVLRGRPLEVDDTLLAFEKAVDSRPARSSSSRPHAPEGGSVHYMLLIYNDEQAWASMPEEERSAIVEEYFTLTHALRDRGIYVGGAPLQPTATATSVRVRDGEQLVTDGPFAETKEQLGGYFLLETDSLDEALGCAALLPAARYGTIEVRPVIPTRSGTPA